jgi:hypothetical protein
VSRARRPIAALVAVGVLVLASCGDDSTGTGVPAPVSTDQAAPGLPPYDASQQLPPNDVAALRRLYDPVLEPLGVRLTRGALIDTTDNRYQPSNDGRHLALYVEPVGEYSNEQYVDGFWTISALVTPDVFARWPQLESYDICQEPLPSVDDDPEPFPLTQINLTREAAAQVDWQDGDLVDLLVLSRTNDDAKVIVNREIRATPTYQAAEQAARAEVDSTDTTNP